MRKAIFLLLVCAAITYAQATPPVPKLPPEIEGQSGGELQQCKTKLAQDEAFLEDWADLSRYSDENAKLGAPLPGQERVVFLGDSITDSWGRQIGNFFPGKPYLNRGISGQTTPQMLIRFRPDVLALSAKAVVILAGTNDIAGNTGPETLIDIEGNLESMAQLARVNGIRVVLASVTPVCDYIVRQTDRRPPEKIAELNRWIKTYCERNGHVYLDYYSAMLDPSGRLNKDLTYDCLHPNAAGYAVMAPLAVQAIETALGSK